MTSLAINIWQNLNAWDTAILLWVNGWHCNYADNLMEMWSGHFVWIPLYIALTVLMFLHFHWKIALVGLLMAIVLLFIDDQVCSSVIRHTVGRLRPSNLDNPISPLIHVVDGYRGGTYGFPSAHATNSWGLAFLMIFTFRRRLLSLTMVVWCLLVCYSRMYLGVHYFGDICAGTLLGMVHAAIIYYIFRRLFPSMAEAFRTKNLNLVQVGLPTFVFLGELVLMLLLAFFVDPPRGI
ncbi:MAG: phosphatase PAP2 family protein [Prevotella sp.]|nr:phosphatase PAP2 family protein [Prevotella sp.]